MAKKTKPQKPAAKKAAARKPAANKTVEATKALTPLEELKQDELLINAIIGVSKIAKFVNDKTIFADLSDDEIHDLKAFIDETIKDGGDVTPVDITESSIDVLQYLASKTKTKIDDKGMDKIEDIFEVVTGQKPPSSLLERLAKFRANKVQRKEQQEIRKDNRKQKKSFRVPSLIPRK